jgi:phage tail protein X
LILAFILFMVAIATPASGTNQSVLTSSERDRDCGGSTIAVAGETVASVAYRCNTTTTAILQQNPGLADANTVFADGQTVLLNDDSPALASAQGQAVSNTVVQPEIVNLPVTGGTVPARAPFAYTVQRGDTLFTLARIYGTTVDAIMLANPGVIANPNWILAGSVIWIP